MTITPREMKELNGECCQDNCSTKAIYEVFWPGQRPKLMCEPHMRQAKGIAGTLGFYLHVKDYTHE